MRFWFKGKTMWWAVLVIIFGVGAMFGYRYLFNKLWGNIVGLLAAAVIMYSLFVMMEYAKDQDKVHEKPLRYQYMKNVDKDNGGM